MVSTDGIGPTLATAVRGGSGRRILFILTLVGGGIVARIPWGKFPNQVRHASVLEVVSWLVVIAVVTLAGCVRALRMGLLMDSTGVVVRNYLRTYRLTWPEIRRFADGS